MSLVHIFHIARFYVIGWNVSVFLMHCVSIVASLQHLPNFVHRFVQYSDSVWYEYIYNIFHSTIALAYRKIKVDRGDTNNTFNRVLCYSLMFDVKERMK